MTQLTNGDDVWEAFFDFDEVIEALDGDDRLTAKGGDDTLIGGFGDDIIRGGRGNDDILGGPDDGGPVGDQLFGEEDDDFLSGGSGNDVLDGGFGSDDLFGGDGNDELFSNGTPLRFVDEFQRSDRGGILDGGAGDDIITVSNDFIGTMTIDGDDDNDTLRFEGDIEPFSDQLVDNFVDLQQQTGQSVLGEAMAITGIENVEGGGFVDVFRGTDGVNILRTFGDDDHLEGRGGADTLDGGDGTDVADYSSSPRSVSIDLTADVQNSGDAEGDILIGIEDIDGSSFNDVIRGDRQANNLYGSWGSDRLEGRGGADTLDGGNGFDAASYESSSARVQVALDDPILGTASIAAGGDAAGDVLISIEKLVGSAHADILTGNISFNTIEGLDGDDDIFGLAENDTLLGGNDNDDVMGHEGNDTIDGGFGDDSLSGGEGIDTVSFESWDPTTPTMVFNENIRIQLDEGSVKGIATWEIFSFQTFQFVLEEFDTLLGFENVRGSNRTETIVGTSGNNVLEGRGGNDTLEGGNGNDTLDGGADSDTASYENSGFFVEVTLRDGVDGTARQIVGNDTLRGIENVRGSAFNDTITGNGQANRLEGGGGGDTLNGGGGADRLIGGTGQDTLSGGTQADTFEFRTLEECGLSGKTADRVADFVAAEGDRIDLRQIDANTLLAGDQAFTFINGDQFSGVAGQLRFAAFAGSSGFVVGDVNGDAVSDFFISVNAAGMQASDFLL
jgi:Ca2+-binding RTX toxin-like protein